MNEKDATVEELQAAWERLCDTLRDAPRRLFDQSLAGAPATSIDPSEESRSDARLDPRLRAEGYRYIARLAGMALERGFEGGDVDHPRLLFSQGPARKIGGDCPDAIYRDCAIDGSGRYRLHGDRGNAASLSLSVNRGPAAIARGKPAVVASLTSDEIEFEPSGSFEILLGGEPAAKNWLPLADDAASLIVRQFFGDREDPRPATLLVERLDRPDEVAPPLDPSRAAAALGMANAFLDHVPGFWAGEYRKLKARPNHLEALSPEHQQRVQALPGGIPLWGHFRLAPDEVLLIEVTPPECSYWSLLCGSPWFESLDARQHAGHVDMDQAELDAEGRLHAVVSAHDPGCPNWIDTGGFGEGFLLLRWLGSRTSPQPVCRVLPARNLSATLPPGTRTVSRAEREIERARRRRVQDLRFQGL